MKKVYISGPITGHDDYMCRFGTVTDLLREQGYIPEREKITIIA